MSAEWHYLDSKKKSQGPHTTGEILALTSKQELMVWKEGMEDWVLAHTLPEFKTNRFLNFLAPQKEPKPPAEPFRDTGVSRIGNDVQITGEMKFRGELSFDGMFKGTEIEGNNLVVGEHAEVHAQTIIVDNLTSAALVEGNAEVAQKCFLQPTAHFQGDLKTFRLAMGDGATFSGRLVISKPPNIVPVEKE